MRVELKKFSPELLFYLKYFFSMHFSQRKNRYKIPTYSGEDGLIYQDIYGNVVLTSVIQLVSIKKFLFSKNQLQIKQMISKDNEVPQSFLLKFCEIAKSFYDLQGGLDVFALYASMLNATKKTLNLSNYTDNPKETFEEYYKEYREAVIYTPKSNWPYDAKTDFCVIDCLDDSPIRDAYEKRVNPTQLGFNDARNLSIQDIEYSNEAINEEFKNDPSNSSK